MTPKPKNIQHICDAQIENKQYERCIYNILKNNNKTTTTKKATGEEK